MSSDVPPQIVTIDLTLEQKGQRQLQELYNHLDNATMGDKHLAWYGQCRAKEMTHEDAIRDTIKHFGIANQAWYQATRKYAEERGHPLKDFT